MEFRSNCEGIEFVLINIKERLLQIEAGALYRFKNYKIVQWCFQVILRHRLCRCLSI